LRSISIVIPAFNEERRLPGTLETLLAYVESRQFDFSEVIVVDDGSTDGTAALVQGLGDSRLRLLRNPGNRGKGYAVRNGMLNARGDWVLFSDADLSTPIEELDRLSAEAEKSNARVVFGSRALDRSLVSVHQSMAREYAGRFFNLTMRMITGLAFEDTQCGFKLFEAAAAKEIFSRQKIDSFGFDVEALFIAKVRKIPAVEVAVRWANAEGTKVSTASGLKAFLDPIRVRWYQFQGCYK
jgi:glycosyltransferase involved in cell wall biosynthesis